MVSRMNAVTLTLSFKNKFTDAWLIFLDLFHFGLLCFALVYIPLLSVSFALIQFSLLCFFGFLSIGRLTLLSPTTCTHQIFPYSLKLQFLLQIHTCSPALVLSSASLIHYRFSSDLQIHTCSPALVLSLYSQFH